VNSINDGVTGSAKKGTDGRDEILVPLTSSLYVKGRLTDREKVLVDVGTGFYVEKVWFQETGTRIGEIRTVTDNWVRLLRRQLLSIMTRSRVWMRIYRSWRRLYRARTSSCELLRRVSISLATDACIRGYVSGSLSYLLTCSQSSDRRCLAARRQRRLLIRLHDKHPRAVYECEDVLEIPKISKSYTFTPILKSNAKNLDLVK
jgi:hypothetical protein